MATYSVCDRFCNAGDKAWILELANGRIVSSADVFELMVSVKFDLPAKTFQLLNKTSCDDVDRTSIDASLRLRKRSTVSDTESDVFVQFGVVPVRHWTPKFF